MLGAVVILATGGCRGDGGSESASVGECGASATRIHAIQGVGRSSPLLRTDPGEEDIVVEAVVTGDFPGLPRGLGGFFLQEEDDDADDDPRTSEGLFVFDPAREFPVSVGDRVRVHGRVAEFFGLTELVEVSRLVVCPRGGSASAVRIRLPVADEADWERWEGMRVEFDQALFVTGHRKLGRFGEVDLASGARLEQPTQRADPGSAAQDARTRNLRRRVLLDDGSDASWPEPTPYLGREDGAGLRLGDSTARVEGILDFGFGRFRVQPTRPIHFFAGSPRPEDPPDVEGTLRVVGWNVENHMNGDGRGGGFPTRGPKSFEESERQRSKLMSTLLRLDPDIAALVEVENDGTGPESAVGQLVQALNDRTPGSPFALIASDIVLARRHPIAVAILYRTDSVAPVGSAAILDGQSNPNFDDQRNRPGLAQSFRVLASGESLTLVVNHFKSKGSDCDAVGDPDEGDGQGRCNLTRARAARALIEWLVEDPTGSPGTPVLLLGDFNAYPTEDPLVALASAGYVDLISRFAGPGEATFVFDGQAGRLDYGLADSLLLPFVGGAAVWHTNADEPSAFDYRLENAPGRFVEDPFRASDHDPVLIGLFPDLDVDGVTDVRDRCPDSEGSATVTWGHCDSGIPNRMDDVGCSLSDELIRALDSPATSDVRQRAIQAVSALLAGDDDRMSPRDSTAFVSCVAEALAEDS